MLNNYTKQINQIINTIHLEFEYSALVLENIVKHKGYFTSLRMTDKKGNYPKIDSKLFLDNLRISKTENEYYVSNILPTKKKIRKKY